MDAQKRQRHGASRGVLVDHRGIKATREFYNATHAPSRPRERQGPKLAVVAIDPIEQRGTHLPPFGREVAAAVAAGMRMNVYLYAAHNAWERARTRRAHHGHGSTLIFPPGEKPNTYRWPTVPNGLLIVAIGQLHQLAFALAQAVVSGGTPMAFAVFGDGDVLIVRSSDWALGSAA